MRDLTFTERTFLERVCKSHLHKRNGYWCFTFRDKHYKRNRVLFQLYLNKKLEVWENVHHKDGNKENDSIENLEIKNAGEHISYHHAGTRGRKNRPYIKSNKLSQEKINEILRLSKTINNYSEIARKVGTNGTTVEKYIKLERIRV